ncbi:MAG: biotin transporter BioY [Anaerotignaceae bacterium]
MKTRDYVLCGLFAAILCVSAFITIPLFFTPIPLTMQVLAVAVTAAVLGGKRGAIAVLIYVLLGCFGLPVFSGMKGGLGVVAGATGGFIWGFIPQAYISGTICDKVFAAEKSGKAIVKVIVALVFGLCVLYICGVIQLMQVANMGIGAALGAAVLPFIPFDIFKIAVSAVIAVNLRKQIAVI